jgi:hypothetical protein
VEGAETASRATISADQRNQARRGPGFRWASRSTHPDQPLGGRGCRAPGPLCDLG